MWAEAQGAVAEGAPPWRVGYVGRAPLADDFAFLLPQGVSWRDLRRAEGGGYRALIRSATARLVAAHPLPVLQVVERRWNLPGGRRHRPLPLPAGEAAAAIVYATHLVARCPVADSHERQMGLLTSPELRRRWQQATGLCHRLSRSDDDLRAFYGRMVDGQDRRRFGDSGALMPYTAFAERLAAGGVLVQVLQAREGSSGQWVSGVLMERAADGLGLAVFRPGVADTDSLSDAALAQLTCYHDIAALGVARQRHQRWLDLGLARALAHNPMYAHKKALGAVFQVAPRCPRFTLMASRSAHVILRRHAPLVLL